MSYSWLTNFSEQGKSKSFTSPKSSPVTTFSPAWETQAQFTSAFSALRGQMPNTSSPRTLYRKKSFITEQDVISKYIYCKHLRPHLVQVAQVIRSIKACSVTIFPLGTSWTWRLYEPVETCTPDINSVTYTTFTEKGIFCCITTKRFLIDLYLDIFAVGREIQLDHKSRNIFAVADPVERRTQSQIIEIDSALHRADGQQPVIRAEPARETGLENLCFYDHVFYWISQSQCLFWPYVLDGHATVSFLAPYGQWIHQQHDELSVLHPDGHHFTVRTVRRALRRMTQTDFVQ